jgi:uncharacterized RDD family membrane protein YckC
MSQYGNPPDPDQPSDPSQPYGAPPPAPPYGAQPANPYGVQQGQFGTGQSYPYGQQRDAFASSGYASWISRVAAYLIDGLLGAVAGLPLWIGYGILVAGSTTTTDANGVRTTHMSAGGGALVLILIGLVTSAAFWIWNVCIKQGRTGATIGKGVLGIRLVNYSGQPIGAGLSFVRQLVHFLDSLACYVGWLWPLWDARKQTFADKIMSTVVVNASNPV